MRRLTGLPIALAMLIAPSSALAEAGVHVDPGSPSGKEYTLLFPKERGNTGGRGGHGGRKTEIGNQFNGRSTARAPAFGVGVKPRGGSRRGGRRHANRRHGRHARAKHGKGTRARHAGGNPGGGVSSARLVKATDKGSAPAVTTGGLAAGVLLVGGLFGVVARRRLLPRR